MDESQLQPIDQGSIIGTTKVKKAPTKGDRFFRYLNESIAILCWLFVVIKLFFFDIDRVILESFFPKQSFILNFRFFIILTILAILLLITKKRRFFDLFLYSLFYPLILFVWKIPFNLLKNRNWLLILLLVDAVASFFRRAKVNFILTTIYLVAGVIIIFSHSNWWIGCSIVAVLFTVIGLYFKKIIAIYDQRSIYGSYHRMVAWTRKNLIMKFGLTAEIKSIEKSLLDEKQLQTWTSNLQTAVIANKVFLLIAKKLEKYQSSKLNLLLEVASYFFLIFVTVLSFGFILFGIYKISPSAFRIDGPDGFFTFFYLSFVSLFFNGLPQIRPITVLPQSMIMLEGFVAILLGGGILLMFVTTVKGERQKEELNATIQDIQNESNQLEQFVVEEFKLSIPEAINELQKLKSGAVSFIYKLIKFIEEK